MAVYHYFSSRDDLLYAVVDSEIEKLADFYDRSHGNESLEAAMVHSMDGYIDYALAHPRIFDYVFAMPRLGARRFPRDFRARRSPTLNLTADLVSSWMKRGRLKRDDTWEISLELWAHAQGYLASGGRAVSTCRS